MRRWIPSTLKARFLVYGALVTLPATLLITWLQARAARLEGEASVAVQQGLILLLVVILLLPLWVFLEREILRPVRLVMRADRQDAAANLASRLVPEAGLPDQEIGEMIRGRNAMLGRLDSMQSAFQRNLRHLAALSSSAASLVKPDEFEGFLQQAVDHVLQAVPADAVQVTAADPAEQMLRVRLCRGFSEEWIREEGGRPVSDCLCGRALTAREPVWVDDLASHPGASRAPCRLDGFRSCVGVPLICGERVSGVMAALRKSGGFGAQDVDFLVAVGHLLGLALENARLLHETRQLAMTDSLTGVYTRRYFIERLEEELRRCRRTGHAFAVVMMDLDNYKAYNDRHGHVAGDRALQEVAALLRQVLRASDVVARYGGDEFILLLPETSKAEAMTTAERIVGAMQDLALEPPAPLGASFGVAAYPEDGVEVEGLVARADLALYRAKARGGSRVAAWSASERGGRRGYRPDPSRA